MFEDLCEIRCQTVGCGFRVPANYFELHPAYTVGRCPRDGNLCVIVECDSDTPYPGVEFALSGMFRGQIVKREDY